MGNDLALVSAAEASGRPIEMCRLICVEQAAGNHNKYWNVFQYPNHTVIARYGRVGGHEAIDAKTFDTEAAARAFLEKKVREKQHSRGYVALRTVAGGEAVPAPKMGRESLLPLAIEQLGARDAETARVVRLFAERNVHEIRERTTLTYDESSGTFSTPLGIVTGDALADARALLAEMLPFVKAKDWSARPFQEAVNRYLMTVPQDFGRSKLDLSRWLPDAHAVAAQSSLLDSLQASLDVVAASASAAEGKEAAATEKVAPPRIFDISLTLVENAREIDALRAFYRRGRCAAHECRHLEVVRVWQVRHKGMDAAFEADGRKVGNITRCWHGSRAGNILSILAKGLIVPPAQAGFCTGRMFGHGVYASDQSTKALNYSYGYWDGKTRDENCFLFVVDMAMGRAYTPSTWTECAQWRAAKPGYDSTFAQGGVSGVANNEMIVYRPSQVNLRYLVEFGPGK